MLEHDDIERAFERSVLKRQRRQVGSSIDPRIVPIRISERMIQADVHATFETNAVGGFTTTGRCTCYNRTADCHEAEFRIRTKSHGYERPLRTAWETR